MSKKSTYGRLIPIEHEEMTVKDLKEILKTCDDSAIIVVADHNHRFAISSGSANKGILTLESEAMGEYIDMYSME